MPERFALQIGRLCEKYKERAHQIVRKVELDVTRKVVLRTPVRTGRARGNWQASIGAPVGSQVAGVDPSGAATIAAAAGVSDSSPKGHVFYLSNNLPYILPLEYGHSKQAPSGMVRITVAEYQAIVAAAAESEK